MLQGSDRSRQTERGRPGTEVPAKGLRPRTPGPGRGPRSAEADWERERGGHRDECGLVATPVHVSGLRGGRSRPGIDFSRRPPVRLLLPKPPALPCVRIVGIEPENCERQLRRLCRVWRIVPLRLRPWYLLVIIALLALVAGWLV